jgi:hypothetical protein
MPNNRVFYAIHSVAFKENGTTPTNEIVPIRPGLDVAPSGRWEVGRGVQSVGMSTTFNFEQVFELGQIETYEYVELEPEIEFTVEKVLDGTKPLYFMVTGPRGSTALTARTADYKVDVAVPIYSDTQTRATGLPISMVLGSGMFLSSVTYTFPVDGNFTESVTLVGNDKIWSDFELGGDPYPAEAAGHTITPTESTPLGFPSGFNVQWFGDPVVQSGIGAFTTVGGEDATVIGSGVQRRESFDLNCSRLPTELPGVSASGTLGNLREHIQTITVSTDLGREDIFELGKKRPFFKFVTFPIEVTTSIEVITSQGDLINAVSREPVACQRSNNTVNQAIRLCLCEGLQIDLGSKNRLQSLDWSGGEAGGDNVTITYNYQNFNDLTITHSTFD